MSTLQFTFFKENLHATSAYLVDQVRFPTDGRSPLQMEKALKNAAIKSFKTRYRKVQSESARPLESKDIREEVLETPVLWHGIGALFCSVTSTAASDGVVTTATVPFPVSETYLIGVTFVVTLQ